MRSSTTVALIAAVIFQPCSAQESVDSRALHDRAIVIDSHSDFLDRSAIDGTTLSEDHAGAQTSLIKLEQGGIDAQFFSVFVPPAYRDYGYVERTYELIDRLHVEVENNKDRIELATTVADIRRIAASGRIAALMGIEGGHSIGNRLAHLRQFYRLGVRYMTLTWSNTNDWADSSGDVSRWSGLNAFGVDVVREMNRLGMMVDVSHVSDETFWDVIENTTAPVIASHSLARAQMNNARNMSDAMLKAVAENGGVIQVSFYSRHLDERFSSEVDVALDAAADRFAAFGKQYLHDPVALDIAQWSLEKDIESEFRPPDMSKIIDHIDHIVQIAGIDHVGLGSDFDGMGAPPAGLEHSAKMPALTDLLVKRGYSKIDVKKILGENLLRVMRANEVQTDR
jgi:membrane dipeptidase